MTETVKNPQPEKLVNACVAAMVNIFLVASTSESRRMAMDFIDDMLVAYCGVTRENEPRSAEEMQAELRENGRARLQALHDALPVGEKAHFNNDKEQQAVASVMDVLGKAGLIQAQVSQEQGSDWQQRVRETRQAEAGQNNGLAKG